MGYKDLSLLLYHFSQIIPYIYTHYYRYHEYLYYLVFVYVAKMNPMNFRERYHKRIVHVHKKKAMKTLPPAENNQL